MDDLHVLYETAVTATSLQELVDAAYQQFRMSVVLTDSLHNVIACSRDISEAFPVCSWYNLAQAGLVPVLREPEVDASVLFRMPTEAQIKDPKPIQTNCCPLPDGSVTYMSDVRDGRHILMKIAQLHVEESAENKRRAVSFAESCYFLYFKLVRLGKQIESGRGNYLQSLIRNEAEDPNIRERWLGVSPPYVLLVLRKRSGQKETTQQFTRESNLLESNLGQAIRTIDDEGRIVMLFHLPEPFLPFQIRSTGILKNLGIPAGISDQFCVLSDVSAAYACAVNNLEAACDFQGFCGCADTQRFFQFILFRSALTAQQTLKLLPPLSRKVMEDTVIKNPELLETLFVWLYCEKNAATAARRMFIHRNTLDNRLKKITAELEFFLETCCDTSRLMFSVWYVLRENGRLQAKWIDSISDEQLQD